jgi:hypothetical protein
VRNPFAKRHPFAEEDLSAHVDGRLPAAESARLEAHLASCESCRRHLAELRAVVEGLRSLPAAPAPRSFVLRPEQVQPRRQAPAATLAWAFGPAGAAAAAFVLLVVLVGVDLGTLGEGGVEEPGQTMLQFGAEEAREAGSPAMGLAPLPTTAPGAAPPEAAGEEGEADASLATAEAASPTPTPPPPAPPGAVEEEEGGAGRWVLRGFEGAAGAIFVAGVAAFVWQRRRGRSAPSP